LAVIVRSTSPSIGRLIDLLAADMKRVNATILSRTGSEVTMIPEVANHLIESGGKRLRPTLTLAMSRLVGYGGGDHVKLAAAVEFMHTATLLHDDVVDESDMRRGRLAARLLWGNEASVDFLLGQAFKMMVEVGSLRALEILSSAATIIAEGEVMQLATAKNPATTEDDYLSMVRAKTAELFAAACEVGPALGARPKGEPWRTCGRTPPTAMRAAVFTSEHPAGLKSESAITPFCFSPACPGWTTLRPRGRINRPFVFTGRYS